MLRLTVAFAHVVTGAARPEAHGHFVEQLVRTAFDPTWNVEHRFILFGAIVLVLFLSGVGLPLPEDLPLTLAGFTTIRQANDHFVLSHYLTTFVVVVIPILLGDILAYGLGARFGLGLRERIGLLRRALCPARLERVKAWFDRYGPFAVFLGRQVAGVRFVTFFMAGSMRVPLPSFVAFDFLGCLVSVPVWLTLGTLASHYGERWLHAAMSRAGHVILLVAFLLILVLALVTKLRGGRGGGVVANESGDVP